MNKYEFINFLHDLEDLKKAKRDYEILIKFKGIPRVVKIKNANYTFDENSIHFEFKDIILKCTPEDIESISIDTYFNFCTNAPDDTTTIFKILKRISEEYDFAKIYLRNGDVIFYSFQDFSIENNEYEILNASKSDNESYSNCDKSKYIIFNNVYVLDNGILKPKYIYVLENEITRLEGTTIEGASLNNEKDNLGIEFVKERYPRFFPFTEYK